MRIDAPKAAAPWHLWLVGGLSLLWNAFGAYDYVMSHARNLDYLRAMTEPYGLDAEVALRYFDSFPVWAEAAWAIGVWSSLLGSVLLLVRSRFALHAFLASLAGLLGGLAHQFGHPLPGLTDSPLAIGMSLLLAAVIVLLAWYARALTRRGVLR